jgi:hypothetical protein
MPRNTLIQWRQGTAAQWTAANPVLASGEPGKETDTGKWKLGDGTTAWASLAYQAAAAGPSQIQAARKAADTILNNTATLTADPELSIGLTAGGVYQVEAFLIYTASTTADLNLGWTYPAGSTMDWTSNALISTITGNTGGLHRGRAAINGALPAGGAGATAGSKLIATPSGILTAGATGNLVLTWAQLVADATDATLYANSTLKLTKLN